ncbi:MAG: hypothetical protein PHE01_11125 [Methanosarcina sp.]|nr:hypothetical protein [Methanosarcina sp.]
MSQTGSASMDMIVQLREKAEETDINQFLKITFGGYTKKSVLQYLTHLRKQQQATADTFERNLQLLFEEKENLIKSKEMLQARLLKTDAEYQNLKEALQANQMQGKDYKLSDILSLKDRISALEEEGKQHLNEKKSLMRKLDHLNNTNEELQIKLEQIEVEKTAQMELFNAQKLETGKQRDLVYELTSQLETEKDEINYLTQLLSEREYNQSAEKVKELTNQLAIQSEIIAKQSEELSSKEEIIARFNDEMEVLNKRVYTLTRAVEYCNQQNDKLSQTNRVFMARLEEEYKKQIELIREKAEHNLERIVALKKLNEADSKISLLELQLEKTNKFNALEDVNDKVSNLETLQE